jgi:hypothetical protein
MRTSSGIASLAVLAEGLCRRLQCVQGRGGKLTRHRQQRPLQRGEPTVGALARGPRQPPAAHHTHADQLHCATSLHRPAWPHAPASGTTSSEAPPPPPHAHVQRLGQRRGYRRVAPCVWQHMYHHGRLNGRRGAIRARDHLGVCHRHRTKHMAAGAGGIQHAQWSLSDGRAYPTRGAAAQSGRQLRRAHPLGFTDTAASAVLPDKDWLLAPASARHRGAATTPLGGSSHAPYPSSRRSNGLTTTPSVFGRPGPLPPTTLYRRHRRTVPDGPPSSPASTTSRLRTTPAVSVGMAVHVRKRHRTKGEVGPGGCPACTRRGARPPARPTP